ncbi:MAG: UDP-N-acetylmuramoyl-tripeptide--D-alanyl-D-alanine ligase [Synergistaceae bacterium]|jgi:UDP-N-acetylmuramoyl-tripeptide--D-alanyl-D-alanine ligase|nr:UDP-N-acetylmuramoyl-tripeptide--D-alanyl-D-alanine ligase [Synergistaceae bacterium]
MKPGREFFTIGEAAGIADGECFPQSAEREAMPQRFKADSREVGRGDVFVAMPGSRDDGHNYIAQAVANGARCVLLSRGYLQDRRDYLLGLGAAFIASGNPERSIAAIARAWLDAVAPRTIGITGSVGKTTTREFIRSALKPHFKVHSAEKSYNTMTGVSMSVLAMPRGTEILVLELGTNHPGEIKELVENFPVSHGIITEVAAAHLEGLGSVEGVLAAKMEITESPALECLSYNSDNDILSAAVAGMPGGEKAKKGGIRQIGVGYSNSGVRISDVRQAFGGDLLPALSFQLSAGERKIACRAGLFGKQHAKNIAFAYAAAMQMGLGDDDFSSSVPSFEIPEGRGVILRGGNGCILIDDTYNANPASMSQSVKNLLEMDSPGEMRRIGILGGMRELGAESGHWHEVVANRASLLDEVYLIGSEWGTLAGRGSIRGVWQTAADFIGSCGAPQFANSAILIKGSRYYGLERILPHLRGQSDAG